MVSMKQQIPRNKASEICARPYWKPHSIAERKLICPRKCSDIYIHGLENSLLLICQFSPIQCNAKSDKLKSQQDNFVCGNG